MSSSWFRIVMFVPNCLWRILPTNQNHVRIHVSGRFSIQECYYYLEFLEDLANKITQWKTARDDNLSSMLDRGGVHAISNVSHLESKIVVLENTLKRLSVSNPKLPKLFQCLVLIIRPQIIHSVLVLALLTSFLLVRNI